MSMPFYVSPEQLMQDKAEYARKGIARGKSIVALEYDRGIVLVAENPSRLTKISEIYDRIAFAGVGRFSEFDQLRKIGVRFADVRGYAYSREDVRGKALANAYSQALSTIFTQQMKPYEVEILVAQVGEDQDRDEMFHILYDGTVMDEQGFTVLGGQAESIAEVARAEYRPDLDTGAAVRLGAKVLAPDVPAFIALEKHTGRLAAFENEGLSSRLFHCQWSSPSLGVVDGRPLVFLGGGDGVCYAFEALAEAPAQPVPLRKVWSFDCNPPHYRLRDGKPIPYYDGDKRKHNSPNKNDGLYVGPSQIIATAVFEAGQVYVAIGQDPAHGRGRGMLHAIDAAGSGDITISGRLWSYDGLDRSIGTVAVAGGLVYALDVAGRLHCVDAQSGQPCWVHETKAEAWGSPLVADGKVFFGNQKSFFIMRHGREPVVLSEIRLGSPVYSSAIAANGVLYVASQKYLWAVANDAP